MKKTNPTYIGVGALLQTQSWKPIKPTRTLWLCSSVDHNFYSFQPSFGSRGAFNSNFNSKFLLTLWHGISDDFPEILNSLNFYRGRRKPYVRWFLRSCWCIDAHTAMLIWRPFRRRGDERSPAASCFRTGTGWDRVITDERTETKSPGRVILSAQVYASS